MKILYVSATALQDPDQLLNAILRKEPLQIQQGNAVVASQHVDGMDIVPEHLVCPGGKVSAVAGIQSVDEQSRKEEVIYPVAFARQGAVDAFLIAGMDLRQQSEAVFIRDPAPSAEDPMSRGR